MLDSRRDDGIRAGRRAALCATGFKRYEQRRAARIMAVFLRIAERLNFRVWSARAPVPAAPDEFSALHQYRADRRIRRRCAATAPRQTDGLSHVIQIIFGKEFFSRVHC